MTIRNRAFRLATAALGAALGVTLALAAPAAAQRVSLDDGADTTATLSDIRTVTVRHTDHRVYVKVAFTDLQPTSEGGLSSASIFYDTTRARRGPERRLATGLQSGSDYQLVRMRGWRGAVGDASSCAHRVRLNFERNTLTSWVARRCLGNPASVRVGVQMIDQFDGSHPVTDWLKGPRKWTRWLSAG